MKEFQVNFFILLGDVRICRPVRVFRATVAQAHMAAAYPTQRYTSTLVLHLASLERHVYLEEMVSKA